MSPRNSNERWSVDPNPSLPREMTVLEAEEKSDSEKTLKTISQGEVSHGMDIIIRIPITVF